MNNVPSADGSHDSHGNSHICRSDIRCRTMLRTNLHQVNTQCNSTLAALKKKPKQWYQLGESPLLSCCSFSHSISPNCGSSNSNESV